MLYIYYIYIILLYYIYIYYILLYFIYIYDQCDIWVCLKMEYTRQSGYLVGNMINEWIWDTEMERC